MSSNQRNDKRMADMQSALLGALDQVFYAILKIKPEEDQVMVLQSKDVPKIAPHYSSWNAYLADHCRLLTPEGAAQVMTYFNTDALLAACQSHEHSLTLTVPYIRNRKTNWLTLMAQMREREDDYENCDVYLFVRKTNEEHLRQSIIDLYVYNNCDYFIYLDAKNNSYTMFSGSKSGTPLPPEECDDYAQALVDYARNYVVQEDQEMVIREMNIDRVTEQLDLHGIHSFSCGVMDPYRGYTRKQLSYLYYDKESQMILLSRTDVTNVYMEKLAHERALMTAQDEAQRDSLTGLFNLRGLIARIETALKERSEGSAFLFIDLDDFKNINDTYGHQQGDWLLQSVAEVLQDQTRMGDIQGRIGGDEFVVFLRGVGGRSRVEKCARRICNAISAITMPGKPEISISCSMGVALVPEDGKDYKTLAAIADKRVYGVKSQGKNGYMV